MEPIDFKNELITLYNAMRWKEHKTSYEARTCLDLRVFITTKYRDSDTSARLKSCDRGDYDPTNEKKTLRQTLIAQNQVPYSQTNPTTNPNTSGQSGNAVEVRLPDITGEGLNSNLEFLSEELKEMEVLSAKETSAFVEEVKKRGRKPKNV